MKSRFCLLSLLIIMLVASSCSNDDQPANEFFFTEIATLDRVTDTGSDFTLYLPDSREPVSLTLPYHLQSSIVKPGNRVMLTFASPSTDPFATATQLRLISYRGVSTLPLKTTTIADPLDGALPFNLQSAWITGPWLNFRAMFPYLPGNVTVDVLTPEDATGPERDIYMIMSLSDPTPTFERESFCSVSLAPLIQGNQPVTRLHLHVYCPDNPTVEHLTLNL